MDGDTLRSVAEQHAGLLDRLAGADVAILDLLGKAVGRPIADLLGRRVRDSVSVYDSSLYMEDLLTPPQREGLAYLGGLSPENPAEMVARKASWLLGRSGDIRIFKIKSGGRGGWARSRPPWSGTSLW
jgi:L-alanine-DL-glutamate epimerase-like enolase superfamily enzyme